MLDRSPLAQLTLWRIREFTREPEALFWVFAFPIVLAFALGLAFKNRAPETVQVAVEEGLGGPELAESLDASDRIEAILLDSAEAALRLRTGRVALVVTPGQPATFTFDSTRTESLVARLTVDDVIQETRGRRDVAEIREVPITEPGARYIDFLIPGLLGLNIMGTGMWGVGFGIVKTRTRKLLKRLLASPMRRSEYLLSYVCARLVWLAFEVGAVLLFGKLVFDVPIRGSLLSLAAVVLLGAATFSGIGLLVASRSRTIEGVSGLMNFVMVPMWIGSGVFFAYSNFPEAVQPFLKVLPLTALNDALRAVLLDGAPLAATAGLLGIMLFWAVSSYAVALKIFRWD
ncbi:MAG: ABC transporter permease [Gemmatimonadales bacterium]|jgi:ABC-type multidrug transport system permease subunit